LIAALTLGQNLPYVWIGTLLVGCLVASVMMSRLRFILTPEQDGRVAA
jgi:hypothetical protein